MQVTIIHGTNDSLSASPVSRHRMVNHAVAEHGSIRKGS